MACKTSKFLNIRFVSFKVARKAFMKNMDVGVHYARSGDIFQFPYSETERVWSHYGVKYSLNTILEHLGEDGIDDNFCFFIIRPKKQRN